MKIAIRSAHNHQATGAKALLDETTESRRVTPVIIKYLKELGHTVLDVTPGNMDSTSDLLYGTNKAKQWGAELFISIHFNKAYNSYNGRIGTEAWVYSKSDDVKEDEAIAQRIVNNLGALGFTNRGVKDTNKSLHELKALSIPSIIVEVCFVEATEDVALYKKLGVEVIGKSIAEAIANKKVVAKEEVKPVKEEVKVVDEKVKYFIQYGNQVDARVKGYLEDVLRCGSIDSNLTYKDYNKVENLIAIGGVPATFNEFSGYTKYWIKGKDRYETGRRVIDVAEALNKGGKFETVMSEYKIK